MNIVSIWLGLYRSETFNQNDSISKFAQCSPKVKPGGAIFGSVLAMNLAQKYLLPKTLNLTPPELIKNPG